MSISSIGSRVPTTASSGPAPSKSTNAQGQDQELRANFENFVGETMFGQMLKSMRKSQHKSAYFHGGRAEEVFQQQLDQVLAQKMSHASADKLAGPMYELFTMNRR
jgi:Rod binding domain-containing protein